MIGFFQIFVILFGVQPFIEYSVHRALHNSYFKIFKKNFLLNPVSLHQSHHLSFKNINNFRNYDGLSEIYLFVSVAWILCPSYWIIWMCILKYEIMHMLIHRYKFPTYSLHHKIHHNT